MTVPADEAVMTNGRPYARLVVATAVAVRVAKLSPSNTDDAFQKSERGKFTSWSPALSSPPPNEVENKVLARLSTSFLPHRQFRFSLLEVRGHAEGARDGRGERRAGGTGERVAREPLTGRVTGR